VQFNSNDALRNRVREVTDQPGSHLWDTKKYYWTKENKADRLLLAWKNITNSDSGWVVIESRNGDWFYKSNGDDEEWTKLERGQTTKLRWDSSGQKIEISLYAPNLSNGWTTEDIQYSFGYSN
jgi:hypothetical protein